MESVTGFAPAFSVRETALLLLEDTDKLKTKGQVAWSYNYVSPRGDVEDRRPYRADSVGIVAAASTHGAPAETGPADDFSSTRERCAIAASVARR